MDRRKFIKRASLSLGSSLIFHPNLGERASTGRDIRTISGIDVVAPSIVEINQTFSIGIRILTKPFITNWTPNWGRAGVDGPFNYSPRGIRFMENVLPQWSGTLEISGDKSYKGPSIFSFDTEPNSNQQNQRPIIRLEGIQFTSPGVKLLRIYDPDSGIEGVSNPIQVKVQAPEERLFWGDLHMHSIYTDGVRVPEEIYSFARNETFLDICAMSEHSEGLTDSEWNYFTEVTNKYNEPGRFVTLVGGEWTSREYGHRNYYYRGSQGPILRSDDPDCQDLDQLYAIAHSQKALIIPHHCANRVMGVDWSKGHDSEVERLVEIHSIWGNSERPAEQGNPLSIQLHEGEMAGRHVVDALKRDYKLGFIAGGDIHDGRPGDELHNLQDSPNEYYLCRRQGLMGVWAKELTREAIFDALWNRRVYGTTNHRTWLKFSINGHPMGSQIIMDDELQIEVEVATNISIDSIELVKNGQDVQLFEPDPEELEVKWYTRESHPSPGTWYYVRVTLQQGKNMSWSSPIWIC